MFISGISTFFILPASITASPSLIYREREKQFLCYTGDCMFLSLAVALSIVYILLGYTQMNAKEIAFIAIPIFLILICVCRCVLRNEKICKLLKLKK